MTPAEFLESTLLDFGFTEVPNSKAQRIARLQRFLLDAHRKGKLSALFVDEAHKLNPDVLEEIRLLGNFELTDEKLLQVALVGQSELDELLDGAQLRQFKQRIAVRLRMLPLASADVEHYLRFRWIKAGGKDLPFSTEAVKTIAQMSQGIPRLMNVICDNALMQAFAEGSVTVQQLHILSACADLRIGAAISAPKPEPAAALNPISTGAGYAIKTFERYDTRPPKHSQSLLTRLAGKLRLIERAETA